MTEKTDFKVGQELIHPKNGKCKITFIDKEHIGVAFESGKEALFRKEHFEEVFGGISQKNEQKEDESAQEWPFNTFKYEKDSGRHFLGSHWKPFFDDPVEIVKHLPSILPKCSSYGCAFGSHHKPPREFPLNWRKAIILTYPRQCEGIKFVVANKEEQNFVESFYPFASGYKEYLLTLDRVLVWQSGVEAQITAAWKDFPITFFDTDFVENRLFYDKGVLYHFCLIGIAYMAKKSQDMAMEAKLSQGQFNKGNLSVQKKGAIPSESIQNYDFSNAFFLFPFTEGDIDDYVFRGGVLSVEKRGDELLGQKGWNVEIAVIGSEEEQELSLKVFISEKAWREKQAPAKGETIEGILWLQGFLFCDNRVFIN
ncbi:MAG: hypothetical protein GYA35_05465, partial [Thermoanaerobaculaceae bacterium]|nr:hypothetical protein [Thermoanaerobaculaceae bacterium]